MPVQDSLTSPHLILVPRYVRVLEEHGRARGMTPGQIVVAGPVRSRGRRDWRYLVAEWTGPRAAFLSLGWTVPSFHFGETDQGHAATLRGAAPVHAGHVWCDGDAVIFRVQLGRAPVAIESRGALEWIDFGGGYTALHGAPELITIDGLPAARLRGKITREWFNGDEYWYRLDLPDRTMLVDTWMQRDVDRDQLAQHRAERARLTDLGALVTWQDREIARLSAALAPKLRLVVDNTRGEA